MMLHLRFIKSGNVINIFRKRQGFIQRYSSVILAGFRHLALKMQGNCSIPPAKGVTNICLELLC